MCSLSFTEMDVKILMGRVRIAEMHRTSEIFFRNSLIPLTPGVKKTLHRSFRSDVWMQSQTVVCFSFWSGRFCAFVPAASEREPRSRSGQRMSECVLHRWSRGLAWHSVHLCPYGEESRAAQRSIPFGCGPNSAGDRASSNACAGAAGSRTPYNRSRYEPGPSVGSSDRWAECSAKKRLTPLHPFC